MSLSATGDLGNSLLCNLDSTKCYSQGREVTPALITRDIFTDSTDDEEECVALSHEAKRKRSNEKLEFGRDVDSPAVDRRATTDIQLHNYGEL